nr:hypothetical protein [uncultured Holophaga sp.]
MQISFSDDVILDSRRAVFLPKDGTLVLADLFLGLGAARRKRPDLFPDSQHADIWERLLGLLDEYQPRRVAVLGDIKPNQGHVEDDEAEELKLLFRKLKGRNRQVVQVVGHPERSSGPVMERLGIEPVELFRAGSHTLMHRRRIFVYPRHEPANSFWINGGLHPLFAVPVSGPDGGEEYIRYPAFLYTGFALVIPPFVSYAQGWEVMQPERLPRQARAWRVLGGHEMVPLSLPDLPPVPEGLESVARPTGKSRSKRD